MTRNERYIMADAERSVAQSELLFGDGWLDDVPKPAPRPTSTAVPRRGNPYVWPTWIAGVLAGQDSCEFAPWFKSHYQGYQKAGNTDFSEWSERHKALVDEQSAKYGADGFKVLREDQTKFVIHGRIATLAGKTDVLAVDDEAKHVIVVECKTREKAQDKDSAQAKIAMYVIRHGGLNDRVPGLSDYRIEGRVVYSNGAVTQINANALDESFSVRLETLIRRVADDEKAVRVPSSRECRFCDLTKADCPAKIEDDVKPVTTEAF